MSPFSKPTIEPVEPWIKYRKAAELLGIDERTLKRWMKDEVKRKALGAVRHGKQWRIPAPNSFNGNSEEAWETHARFNLNEIGVNLKPSLEIDLDLDKLGEEFARYELESYRLWLAAHLQLSLKSDGVTKEDITAILLLWQTACKILDPLPEGTRVDKLAANFPDQLRACNLSEARIRFIMSYWPKSEHFKRVRVADTLGELEKLRHGVDFAQAVKTCKNLRKNPTAEYLRPLPHKNIMEHINDTREVVPPFATDLRQPQKRRSLRTFRKHYPLRKLPQKEIVATIYDVQDRAPSADEKPRTHKTPVRDSTPSEKSPRFPTSRRRR